MQTRYYLFMFVLQFNFMRTRKIQSKIEPELEEKVKQQPDYGNSMSNYVRELLIKKTKFKVKV